MKYGAEALSGLWAEIQPLIEQHYEEIAFYKDMPLAPNRKIYDALETSGCLRCYTARTGGGELVGYYIAVVSPMLHYDCLQAMEDVVFLRKDCRSQGAGLGLLRFAHAELAREFGTIMLMHHVKLGHPALGEILKRDGFDAVDTIYCKRA